MTPALPVTAAPVLSSTKMPASVPATVPPPSPTPSAACDADRVLKRLKSAMPYEQSVITYNIVKGDTYLAIWFVDPDIDPAAGADTVGANSDLAIRQAAATAAWLNAADACVGQLFTVINPIVVDRNYNGWFSGDVALSVLPATTQPTDQQVEQIRNSFSVSFLRNRPAAPPQPAPDGSCAWPKAAQNLQHHFASARENTGFFFVRDDLGVNVWAQWDGPTDPASMTASLGYVTLELQCLFPVPTNIFVQVVDDAGNLNLLGQVSDFKASTEQYKVLYP